MGLVLVASLGGCGVIPLVGTAGHGGTAPEIPGAQPKGPVVASGVVNGVAWSMRAWVESGLTCTSFDSTSEAWSGCGNGSLGRRDLDVPRQNGARFISLTGLVGSDIATLRVHFGDGSVMEYATLSSPIPGTRVAGVVVPAAPVPVSMDGLGSNGDIVATTDF
jgi:hypothetical protein